jgi:hypothetical protein
MAPDSCSGLDGRWEGGRVSPSGLGGGGGEFKATDVLDIEEIDEKCLTKRFILGEGVFGKVLTLLASLVQKCLC